MKLTSILLFVTVSSFGQGLFIKEATLSISGNTVFSVNGDALNEGTIVNNGDFQISGTWLNNGMYEAASGAFTLSSTGDQIINHNAQSFNKLAITGGGKKVFQADLDILQELTLSSGLLVSEDNSKIFAAENLNIVGGSDQSHVVGEFYNVGSGSKLFPVGDGITYNPITISTTSDDRLGVQSLSPNPLGDYDNSLTELFDGFAWRLIFEVGQSREISVTFPWTEPVSYPSPVVAFSPEGFTYRAVSPLSLQDAVASSSMFVASTGLLSLGNGFAEGELPALSVFNLVTPNGDGIHDFLKIENIEFYPDNRVSIFNRWGDQLFELTGYDNIQNVFSGISDRSSKELSDGTYYYVIDDGVGKRYTGFFVMRN